MQYQISGQRLDVTQAMREYVKEKLQRVAGHHDRITTVHVILKAESHLKIADATMHLASGKTIHADAQHEDMYAAIDLLADRLDKQVRRHKDRTLGLR